MSTEKPDLETLVQEVKRLETEKIEKVDMYMEELYKYAERGVSILADIIPRVDEKLGKKLSYVVIEVNEMDGTVNITFVDTEGNEYDSIDLRDIDEKLSEVVEELEALLSGVNVEDVEGVISSAPIYVEYR